MNTIRTKFTTLYKMRINKDPDLNPKIFEGFMGFTPNSINDYNLKRWNRHFTTVCRCPKIHDEINKLCKIDYERESAENKKAMEFLQIINTGFIKNATAKEFCKKYQHNFHSFINSKLKRINCKYVNDIISEIKIKAEELEQKTDKTLKEREHLIAAQQSIKAFDELQELKSKMFDLKMRNDIGGKK